jgi:TP901 family phage tail tape measure protein
MAIDRRDLLVVLSARNQARAAFAELDRAIGGVEKSHGRVRRSFAAIGRAGAVATVGLVVGAAKVGASAITMAADYEQALDVLKETSGASQRQMRTLGREAIKLGNDVKLPGVSALDAAQAMLELSKGGLTVNDTLKATRGTLQLATAGEIEFVEAAKLTVTTLKAFRLEGSAAGRIADLLAAAANASSADVGEMAISLQQASAASYAARQSVSDTVTALALLADAGIKGSDAGTSLRVMLQRLTAPTQKSADLMKELGLSVFNARGEVRPMPELVAQFSDKLGGLSDKQKLAALQTIFGTDAMRAANIVLLDGLPNWDKTAKAVGRQGAAADLAAARNRGFKGAVDGFKGALETAAIVIGTKALPTLTEWIRKLTSEGIPAVGKMFRSLHDELSPELHNVSKFIRNDLTPALKDLKTGWNQNSEGISELAGDLHKILIPVLWLVERLITQEVIGGIKDLISYLGSFGRFLRSLKALVGIMMRGIVNAFLWAYEKIIEGAAATAEALHLPIAASLRASAQKAKEFRQKFNAEMNRLDDEDVKLRVKGVVALPGGGAAISVAGQRAYGGPLEGPGPRGKDSMLFWGAPGEHVLTAREVAAAGGHRAIEAWRKAVLRGGMEGFAGGGAINAKSYLPRASTMADGIERQIDAIAKRYAATHFIAMPLSAGGGNWGSGSWMRAINELKSDKVPYNIISTFRRGAVTPSGRPSYHSMNRAVDLTGPNMFSIWKSLIDTNPTELIYSGAPYYKSGRGWRPIGWLDATNYANHIGHVHAAYRNGAWRTREGIGYIHDDEMILPKPVADPVRRSLARSDGSGGDRAPVSVTNNFYNQANPQALSAQLGWEIQRIL